jgi:hypothetical protein
MFGTLSLLCGSIQAVTLIQLHLVLAAENHTGLTNVLRPFSTTDLQSRHKTTQHHPSKSPGLPSHCSHSHNPLCLDQSTTPPHQHSHKAGMCHACGHQGQHVFV